MKLKMLFVILFCGVVQVLEGKEWRPPEKFLKAVCFVESSNGQFVIGDDGNSLGHFQLSEGAWLDVNEWRNAKKLKTYNYKKHVMNPEINRSYASDYLTILHGKLSKELKRKPSHSELYAAYNMGIYSFAQCGYDLERVNSVTRAKCGMINSMMKARASS
ncbi:MAG: transglycosylase SLT domain-containing protein [Verrucomicrobiales bacterium]